MWIECEIEGECGVAVRGDFRLGEMESRGVYGRGADGFSGQQRDRGQAWTWGGVQDMKALTLHRIFLGPDI